MLTHRPALASIHPDHYIRCATHPTHQSVFCARPSLLERSSPSARRLILDRRGRGAGGSATHTEAMGRERACDTIACGECTSAGATAAAFAGNYCGGGGGGVRRQRHTLIMAAARWRSAIATATTSAFGASARRQRSGEHGAPACVGRRRRRTGQRRLRRVRAHVPAVPRSGEARATATHGGRVRHLHDRRVEGTPPASQLSTRTTLRAAAAVWLRREKSCHARPSAAHDARCTFAPWPHACAAMTALFPAQYAHVGGGLACMACIWHWWYDAGACVEGE
jgi:hypothetical protein